MPDDDKPTQWQCVTRVAHLVEVYFYVFLSQCVFQNRFKTTCRLLSRLGVIIETLSNSSGMTRKKLPSTEDRPTVLSSLLTVTLSLTFDLGL